MKPPPTRPVPYEECWEYRCDRFDVQEQQIIKAWEYSEWFQHGCNNSVPRVLLFDIRGGLIGSKQGDQRSAEIREMS